MSAGHLRFSAKQQKLYCHIHFCKIFVSMLHTAPSERKALPKNVLKIRSAHCTASQQVLLQTALVVKCLISEC